MTKEELKQLSDNTFTSNNEQLITADKHRYFNEQLIDSVYGVTDTANSSIEKNASNIQTVNERFGEYFIATTVNPNSNILYANITGRIITLIGIYKTNQSSNNLQISNIPIDILPKIVKVPIILYTDANESLPFDVQQNGNNLQIYSTIYTINANQNYRLSPALFYITP